MQVVYSLDIETQDVKLHKTIDHSQAQKVLDETALEFLAYEEGRRHAKILEGELNYDTQEPGYFLHRDNDRIVVYKKIQHLHQGWVGASVQYEIKHVMNFALTDFLMTPQSSFAEIRTVPPRSSIVPRTNSGMDAVTAEFKEKIRKRVENEPVVVENEEEWDEDRTSNVSENEHSEQKPKID